jgi:ribosomal protein S27AE
MPWTAEQLETLYTRVYRNERLCPVCGGTLSLKQSGEIDEVGTAACPACAAEHLIARRNDPLRTRFRALTDEEQKQIVRADKSRKQAVCPIDGTVMDVTLQRSLGRTSNVVLRCPRCAQTVSYVRLHG